MSRCAVFLDPSSRAVGWAVFNYEAGAEFACKDAGELLAAGKTTDARIDSLCHKVTELLKSVNPDDVVLEKPSGMVHARHGGGGRGLSVYGYAVGRIEGACLMWASGLANVIAISEAQSTGGHGKEKRKRVALGAWPRLANIKDWNYNVSDAIALGVWWLQVFPKLQAKKARKRCRK